MDLQTIFYILGIAVMVSWLLFFVVAMVLIIFLYKIVKNIKQEAVEKVASLREIGKTEIIGTVLGVVGNSVVNSLKKKFFNSEEERS